eukprot:gene28947-32140_t
MGPGQVVGSWELQSELGTGNFSKVYLARHASSGRVAAVKVLNRHDVVNREDILKAEVEALSHVSKKLPNHPNLVSLIEVLEDEKYVYIVMEACHGSDLSDIVESPGEQLDEPQVADLVRQVATVLRDLHNIGVVHRDIKPGNLKLQDRQATSNVKLIDFGMARIRGLKDKKVEIMGSEDYVAPEVLSRQKCYSVRVTFTTSNAPPTTNSPSLKVIWTERSFEVRDLLRRLLVKQPALRASASETCNADEPCYPVRRPSFRTMHCC